MVFFVCCVCGDGLKKNQVESHMNSCRSRSVSCIDCNKEFSGSSFKVHSTCISESKKYESKSYVEKANKGDIKQQSWLEKVQTAVVEFRGSARGKALLQGLADYPNLPRKKSKFVNFIKNSFRSVPFNDALIEEVWTVIDNLDKASKQQQQQQKQQQVANGKENASQQQGVKRKVDDDDQQQEEEEAQITANQENNCNEEALFDWYEQIKKQCKKLQDDNNNNQISITKLEKKIFKKFKKLNDSSSLNENEDQIRTKFKKKLLKKIKKNSSDFVLINENPNEDDQIINNSGDDDYYANLFVKFVEK